jgi:hypothetical protein
MIGPCAFDGDAGRKHFFFEKKKQKTFVPLPLQFASVFVRGIKDQKSFCFFFFRKRRLFLTYSADPTSTSCNRPRRPTE